MKVIKLDPNYEGKKPLWGTAIYPGQVILITATYKAGKSVLLMSLFGNLALGRLWGPWKPERPIKTLYVAFEDDEDDIQISLKPFGGTENFRVAQREWTEHDKTFSIKEVEDVIKELDWKPDIVVLDPWLFGHNFDPNDAVKTRAAIKPIRNFARSNDISVFLVHHDRKGNPEFEDDPWYSAAGSHALGASVDAQWNIVKPKNSLRYFQITYARKRRTERIKLMINYDEVKGIGVQYKGGHFQFPDFNP